MQTHNFKFKTRLLPAGAAAAAILAVCIPFAGMAGIQGSGVRAFAAVGSVTLTGTSLSVGGVPYSDSGASVQIDGQSGTVSQIRAGDVVTAYGNDGNGNNSDVIQRLTLNHSVRARVESVNAADGTFVAAGQTIQVNSQTVLDPALAVTGLSVLIPGASVEVSGWSNSTGEVVASRVDLLVLATSTQVNGEVASLDSSRHRFNINLLTVDFSNAQVKGNVTEGADVIVVGAGFDSNGTLVANSVQLVQPLQVAAGQTGRLEGIITSVTSGSNFEVDGQAVQVTSATKVSLHGPVSLNARVKVSGVFDANGVLVADKLQTKGTN